jgi:hypothetical protein
LNALLTEAEAWPAGLRITKAKVFKILGGEQMNRLKVPLFMCVLLAVVLLSWGIGTGVLAQAPSGSGSTLQPQEKTKNLTPSQKRAEELSKRSERMLLKEQWAEIRRIMIMLGPGAEGSAPKLAQ